MNAKIHYTKPSITELEVEYATDAARNGWGPKCYDYMNKFEAGFRRLRGHEFRHRHVELYGRHAHGAGGAGHRPRRRGDPRRHQLDRHRRAYRACGRNAGAGRHPPDSWCIDPDAAEAAITPRTKAIVATHIYGNLCDLARLQAIADAHGIALIEDAAEAIGSQWHGRPAGSIGRFGTFSFHGTKTITTGEGGMFVTNDAGLYETVLTLSNHGRARRNAAILAQHGRLQVQDEQHPGGAGCAQIERIDELTARKREIFARLPAHLPVAGCPESEPEGCRNGYSMPTIVFEPRLQALEGQGHGCLEGRTSTLAFSSIPSRSGDFETRHTTPVSHDISSRAFNLPCYHDITDANIQRVVGAIADVFA